MNALQKIELRGFKSILGLDLELRSLNVVIGVNGAGKSNLISFFTMLNEMMGGRLRNHITTHGGASAFLHYGPKTTLFLDANLSLQVSDQVFNYQFEVQYAERETLTFGPETITYSEDDHRQIDLVNRDDVDAHESGLKSKRSLFQSADRVFRFLERCSIYHFHDTSRTANIHLQCDVGNNRWFERDGRNLAAVLYRLREEQLGAYDHIVRTIRQIAPFFEDFELEPVGAGKERIILNWRERESALVFGSHQLSDGTLRAICLITLLMQPVADLPSMIIIDEPELGLHPAAQAILAGLLKKASHHCQVLVATQSVSLLDHFDADDVIVVDREAKESKFRRLSSEALVDWLEEYTIGELWQKNVVGGGPF